MKSSKKLIPSLCLLVVSAILLGTSTFAWFTMNSTVAVVGMTVTARQGGGIFFQVVNYDEEFDNERVQDTAVANNPEKRLYPVVVGSALDATDNKKYVALAGTEQVTALQWFTGMSNDPTKADLWSALISVRGSASGLKKSGLDKNVLTNTPDDVLEHNEYTLLNVFKARTNPQITTASGAQAEDLLITDLTVESDLKGEAIKEMMSAVRVLIVCQDKAGNATNVLFNAAGEVVAGTAKTDYDAERKAVVQIYDGTIPHTEDAYLTIYTYVFFDGDDASMFTNNVDTNGYKVSFNLEIGDMPELAAAETTAP